jgi:hypothetical protein
MGMKEAAWRPVAWCREFADGHSDFVAGVAPGTVYAVLQHFVAQGLMFGDAEVEVLEESGDAGEKTDAPDAAGFGLIEEGVDEQAAGPVSLGVGMNDDGADLGEVPAVDVECGTTDELAGIGFDDGEGADVRANLRVGAAEESAIAGEAVDQVIDGAGVLQLRFTRSHGCCCELGFRWDEGGWE